VIGVNFPARFEFIMAHEIHVSDFNPPVAGNRLSISRSDVVHGQLIELCFSMQKSSARGVPPSNQSRPHCGTAAPGSDIDEEQHAWLRLFS